MIGKLFAHLTPSLHRHALYLLQVREVFNKASPVLLIRFLGTSPDSSTIQPLLHSLCVQISYLYDQPIEDIPSDLVLLQVRQIHRNPPFLAPEAFLNSKVITLYMYMHDCSYRFATIPISLSPCGKRECTLGSSVLPIPTARGILHLYEITALT